MSLFDHVALVVSDYPRSKAFYDCALAPLGVKVMDLGEKGCGYGRDEVDFWISAGPASFHAPEHVRVITPTHIAFAARSRAEVDAFYKAAIAAGGKDFGAPGLRPHYHANYYAAFVLDPDGHDIEAVCHKPA
jgi:catechol 2,3-dioxygenase-like lactoylglutathione lyase family enzyme